VSWARTVRQAQRTASKSAGARSKPTLQRAYAVLEGLSRVESAQDVRVREGAQRREEAGYKLANAKRRKASYSTYRQRSAPNWRA